LGAIFEQQDAGKNLSSTSGQGEFIAQYLKSTNVDDMGARDKQL